MEAMMKTTMTLQISTDAGIITNVAVKGIPGDYSQRDVVDAVEYYAERGNAAFAQALPYVRRGCIGKPEPGVWVFLDDA
jgi:hypothetical protein